MLLKQEMEHDEIFEDTWEPRENQCLLNVKNDVLSTVSVMLDIRHDGHGRINKVWYEKHSNFTELSK